MAKPTLLQATIGTYRLVDFLGAGGMGEVYRAIDNRTKRVVAIKVLSSRDPGFVARFSNEARIQARLRHPNIATFYEFLEFDERPCIVMECVEGQTLHQYLQNEGPFPVGHALAIFQAVVDAIAYMHDHNIVHRDIKTGNIKITPTGQVKLLDFGIAKGPSSPGLTATGAVVGTPEYLSPEQLKGHKADARSDIWALGILLYEMLTGHVPFEANNLLDLYGKISKAVFVPPAVLNPEITSRIEAIIAHCLKKKPTDRYASARELRKAVTRVAHPVTRSFRIPVGRVRDIARKTVYQARHAISGLLSDMELTLPHIDFRLPRVSFPQLPAVPPAVMRSGGLLLGVILIGSVLYYLWPDQPVVPADPTPPELLRCTSDSTHQAGTFAVKIRVMSGTGHARVVGAEGAPVGTTPCWIRGRANTKASFVLHQEGYLDKTIYVDFHERRSEYNIPMDRAWR